MNLSSEVSPDFERAYLTEVLKTRMFGAFIEAVKSRRDTDSMKQKTLAERLDKSDTNTSKMLAGPRNWQLSTIAEILYALELEIEFAFVDRRDKNHIFTDTGERYRNWALESYFINNTQIDMANVIITSPRSYSYPNNRRISAQETNYNLTVSAAKGKDITSEDARNFIYVEA